MIKIKYNIIKVRKKKKKIRSTQSSSLLCSNSGSQIFTSVNTGHRKTKPTIKKIKRGIQLGPSSISIVVFVGYILKGKEENSEHTIIITALLKLRKSNIHVGEYRPQNNSKRMNNI